MPRPSGYNAEIHPDWAWSLAAKGLTNKEIAEQMGVATSTFNKWRTEHEELEKAVTEGKETADAKVERSLFERAIGYTYEEKKVITTINPKTGETNPLRIEKTTKVVPPDTTAQIFWLKNRRPEEWRDRKDVDVSNSSDFVFNIKPASEAPKEKQGEE